MKQDKITETLFSFEDIEYLDKANKSPLLEDIYKIPGIEALTNHQFWIKRGINYIILAGNMSLFEKEEDEKVVHKLMNVLSNLDLIENNIEALITKVEGTSSCVGDKSAAVIAAYMAKHFKTFGFDQESYEAQSYSKITSVPDLNLWIEYIDSYLNLIKGNMFSTDIFKEYTIALENVQKSKKDL